MFYVYVINNNVADKIYIGQTRDLETRLKRHNGKLPRKKGSYTSINKGKWQLVYREEYSTRIEAVKREKQLKSAKGREFIRKIISGR